MRLNIKATITLVVVALTLVGGVAFAHRVRVRQMALSALDTGRTAYERKDRNEASRQLKVYLLKHPDDVEILRMYGRSHLAVQPNSLDNIRSAIGAFERVLRNIPADAEASIKLARIHYKVGNYSEAIYVLRRRLAAEPDDALASLWLARVFVAQHDFSEARELLLTLSQQQPPMMKSFGLLAAIELTDAKSDANDRARKWLDSAVNADATSAEALVQRARFRRIAQKDDSGARQDATTAQALQSTDPGVQLLLADEWIALDELVWADQAIGNIRDVEAETLEEYDLDRDEFLLRRYLVEGQLTLKSGDALRGEAVLKNAMTTLIGPTRANFVPMAVNLALEARNVSEARSIIDEYGDSISREEGIASPLTKKLILAEAAIAEAEEHPYAVINRLANFVTSEPGMAEAWRLLGRAYRQTDQPRLARRAFEQHVRLTPDDEDSLFELARLWRKDDPTRAQSYVQRLCNLAPDRVDARALQIAVKIDVAEHSKADLSTLAKLASDIDVAGTDSADDVQMACQKARLLVLQDDCSAARDVLERASEGDNGLPAAVKLIGVHQQAGELESAISVCDRASQRWPTVAATRILHSELLAQAGSVDAARSVLERAVDELQEEEKLTAQVALAQFDLDHDRREHAISGLKKLAQTHPDNVKLRLGLLRLPEIQRDHDERIRLVEEIHSIEGDKGLAWRYEQALAYLQQVDWQTHRRNIENNLEYCIAADNQWSAPVVALGETFERLGELQRAKQVYRKGFELEFAGTTIASRFLRLLIQQREFNEAAGVLARFPAELATLESYRIDVAVGLGRYDEAIQRLERKLEESPEDDGARILLAKLVCEEQNDISEAMWLLEQQPTNSMTLISAKVSLLHAEHRDEEAIELLTSLESQVEVGAKPSLLGLRAKLLESLGRTDEADVVHRAVMAIDPSAASSNDYAEFLLRRGRQSDAIEVLESSLIRNQGDFALRRTLGRALTQVQDGSKRTQGLAILDDLLNQKPADIELLLAKAKTFAANADSSGGSSNLGDSEKTLRRVLSIQPWNSVALGELAWLIGVDGDRTGEALEMTNRGLSLQPDDPRLLHCRAAILTRLKRTEAARTDLLRCVHQENISGMTLFHALLQLAQLETTERHCSAAKSLLDEAMGLDGVDHASRDGSCLQIEQLLSECEEGDHGADDGTTFGFNGAAMVGVAHSVAP